MDDFKPQAGDRVLVHFKFPEPCDVFGTVIHPPDGGFYELYSVHVDGKRSGPIEVPIGRLKRPPQKMHVCYWFHEESLELMDPRSVLAIEPQQAAEIYVENRMALCDANSLLVRVCDKEGQESDWLVHIKLQVRSEPYTP